MSRNQALLRHFQDRQCLRELLARFPSIIDMFPPAERENWREYCGSIVELSEVTLPSRAEIQSLIYRVIYFAEPSTDPILVRKDKKAIGILFFRPHLFDFEIPILKLSDFGVLSCPTPEWDLAHFILPTLARWAPAHEMDFWEWRAWADFLFKRLEKETKLSIPAKGHWEIRKEKIEEKEIPPPPESEWTGWYDGLNELSLEERERYEKEARAEEEKRIREMRHKPPKIFRKKVYIEGWADILLECMDLGLAKVETEDDIRKIIGEAKTRWQGCSL